MPTQRLTLVVTTNTDQARLLDLLIAFGEVLADGLDDGDATFDDGTACVEDAPVTLSIPARDFEEGVPEGGRITFEPWSRDGCVGFKVTTYNADGTTLPVEYVYFNPSTGGGSPDCFVYHGVTGDPFTDHPQVFVNVGAKRPKDNS